MERTIRVGQYEIRLIARDQYNDYSVMYDYAVRVTHIPTRRERQWQVGSAGPRASDRILQAFETARAWAVRQ